MGGKILTLCTDTADIDPFVCFINRIQDHVIAVDKLPDTLFAPQRYIVQGILFGEFGQIALNRLPQSRISGFRKSGISELMQDIGEFLQNILLSGLRIVNFISCHHDCSKAPLSFRQDRAENKCGWQQYPIRFAGAVR